MSAPFQSSSASADLQIPGQQLVIQRIVAHAGVYSLTAQTSPALHFRAEGRDPVHLGPAGEESALFPGACVFVPANCTVLLRCGGTFERWSVTIHQSAVQQGMLALPNQFKPARYYDALDIVFKLYAHFLRGQSGLGPGHAQVYEQLMLIQLDRMYGHGHLHSSKQDDEAMVMSLTYYINQRLAYALTVGDMANHLKLSKFRLLRLLRNTLNITPLQFLLDCRIERAKQLLLESDLSIGEVAMHTGFSTQSHFTTAFGSMVGASPGAFRRAHQSGA